MKSNSKFEICSSQKKTVLESNSLSIELFLLFHHDLSHVLYSRPTFPVLWLAALIMDALLLLPSLTEVDLCWRLCELTWNKTRSLTEVMEQICNIRGSIIGEHWMRDIVNHRYSCLLNAVNDGQWWTHPTTVKLARYTARINYCIMGQLTNRFVKRKECIMCRVFSFNF